MTWHLNSRGSLAAMLVGTQGQSGTDTLSLTHVVFFFNLNNLLTHKDQISHRNSDFWKTEDPASVGPHS